MQKRVFSVLLIATPYDAFMMEEDGRVEEQVYYEYVALNLSSPPRFSMVANYEEAFECLESKHFDLIMAMPGVDVSETFTQAKLIKQRYPDIPFVVLTPFSKEVRRRIANEDLSGVDYVFSWLGNVDLILAIIKLMEDRMNADIDILDVGVQCILLVEDSIRFYSSVLPHLFKHLLKQSKEFSTEALNDHERMLRMRGRPKVLLARDYEEAKQLFDRYGKHMLGIISDVRFPREGVKDPHAGMRFAAYVHEHNPFVPVILESQEIANRRMAEAMRLTFLDKSSKTLPQDLRKAVDLLFGFGDFIVKDPLTGNELMRFHELKDLQMQVNNIPSEALFRHCANNDFSRWLYSRAIFPIAEAIGKFRFESMDQAPLVRQMIFDCIVEYRRMKNRGVVAIFRKGRFDRYSNFARIGQGSLGGKGRGLAFIDQIIKRHPEFDNLDGISISIPRTIVICTDIFDEFMETNNLYPIALSDASDEEILKAFLNAKLPMSLREDFDYLYDVVDRPLAVRSSSLLEDSHYQPFAGIYSTYMIPHLDDREKMIQQICYAVKSVYASVFFRDSKSYMNATSNVIDQEKMAVILQEVVGDYHDGYYYPSFSGVGRSINYYPVGDEQASEGVVEVAAGLGKYIVDGGMALRFSPRHPAKALQTSTVQLALRDTQKQIYALQLSEASDFKTDDAFNLKKISVAEAFKSGSLKYLVSTFDLNDYMIRDSGFGPGRKLVTFANVLKQNVFPLAEASQLMLATGQYEMGRPVEIEFAGIIDPDAAKSESGKGMIYWLQMRPIVDRKEMLDDSVLDVPDERLIVKSDSALGHGLMDNVKTVVYVRSEGFDPAGNVALAQDVDAVNRMMTEQNRPYVLIGPGRWGSSDSALGIPVRWPQIAGARVIVEYAMRGYRIEPSQGTHFFQNLTSFGVGYFTVDPSAGNGFFDEEYLNSLPAIYEKGQLRVVEFPASLPIAINGRKGKGIVGKPNEGAAAEEEEPAGEE
ncbi:MAG: PEP/pyruvate-binding domain-containing protein [Bacteroidales bacterium]|nr:PEP/pyruvate-binding domain-containing protein [Bacteroidales bacterium]